MGNWEEVVMRKKTGMTGSCTEAQVSHVLSERFSRDPLGWSEEGLGKLTKLRVYEKNGGKINAKDFKEGRNQEENETYCEYADKIINESIKGAIDWSIFDGEPLVIDGTSGIQIAIHGIGRMRNTLWS